MAAPLRNLLSIHFLKKIRLCATPSSWILYRNIHWSRHLVEQLWEKPDSGKSLDEVMKEKFPVPDSELFAPVNIGFSLPDSAGDKSSNRVKIARRSKSVPDETLERSARERQLKIPLDEVELAWKKEQGPYHTRTIAEHYDVYKDLFGLAYFYPTVDLEVLYPLDGDSGLPVCRGNQVQAMVASRVPDVHYEADPDSLWTLVLTSPDEHLTDNNKEYLHWMIGNIPGNQICAGEVLCDYMPPIPTQGTGRHRYVYILYKQDKRLDFTSYQKPGPCSCLKERTFETYQFYKEFQDDMTPAGLSFFQAEWDETVANTFREFLNMKEPSFEYDFPHDYRPGQDRVPFREPFNSYLDRYRDRKEIAEQVLKEKLKMINPFKPHPKQSDLPNIYPRPHHVPFWYKEEEIAKLYREGKWKGLNEGE